MTFRPLLSDSFESHVYLFSTIMHTLSISENLNSREVDSDSMVSHDTQLAQIIGSGQATTVMPDGGHDPLQQLWDEDARRQNLASGVQITTESFHRRLSKFERWAVNMDRCDVSWDVIRHEDTPPRFILRWNPELIRWECDRVIFPKATAPITGGQN